jgi:hypothetical protein
MPAHRARSLTSGPRPVRRAAPLRALALASALAAVAGLAAPRAARAGFDEFAEEHSPTHFELRAGLLTLALKGEVELELHDLEGSGGPGYDSPTDTRTIGTRSPVVEIDTFWLAPRVGIGEALAVNSVLEFTQTSARVSAVWFDVEVRGPAWLTHHVEVGYHTPIVKIDRVTERYPLIGSVYWREPEVHVSYEGSARVCGDVTVDLGVSLAMMRPLGYASVQESTSQVGTINVIAYGPARAFSGNGPVGGGRLRVSAWGAFVEGFGFVGRLAAEGGTDVLRSGFVTGTYTAGGRDFWWAGGRLGYQGHGLTAFVEAIASREDELRRWGAYGQASYRVVLSDEWRWLPSLEPVVRYEAYRILDSTRVGDSGRALRTTAVGYAVTWDWDILTLSLVTEVYRDIVRLRVEYYFIWEKNGVPALSIADEPFRNDELLVQLEVRF